MVMKRSRRPTAPTVPQIRPRNCWRLGRVRTASAITSALSPARARSMSTIFRTPSTKSKFTSPPSRSGYSAAAGTEAAGAGGGTR